MSYFSLDLPDDLLLSLEEGDESVWSFKPYRPFDLIGFSSAVQKMRRNLKFVRNKTEHFESPSGRCCST